MAVSFKITLQNLDYATLTEDRSVLATFEEHVGEALVDELGHNVSAADIFLVVSAGSLVVDCSVKPPHGHTLKDVQAAVESAKYLAEALQESLNREKAIEAIALGPIVVSKTTKPVITEWVPVLQPAVTNAPNMGLIIGDVVVVVVLLLLMCVPGTRCWLWRSSRQAETVGAQSMPSPRNDQLSARTLSQGPPQSSLSPRGGLAQQAAPPQQVAPTTALLSSVSPRLAAADRHHGGVDVSQLPELTIARGRVPVRQQQHRETPRSGTPPTPRDAGQLGTPRDRSASPPRHSEQQQPNQLWQQQQQQHRQQQQQQLAGSQLAQQHQHQQQRSASSAPAQGQAGPEDGHQAEISQVMEAMDVDEAAARSALQASGWFVAAACERLIGESPPTSSRSVQPAAGGASGGAACGVDREQREKIADVMNMGFSEEQALGVLLDCDWNVAQAVEKLTGTPR